MNYMNFLRTRLETISVEDYIGYMAEVDSGYIRMQEHPENENIQIFNYTELATFERRWNKYTMSARGLILDTTHVKLGNVYILAKPFEKFFNYGENPEYEKDIDFNEIDAVYEKMDGSMGVSYFFDDGIRFATRGSFTSEQALKANEIWNEKYATKFSTNFYISFPFTMITEIIYPENRIVVDYGKQEDLVLLGCRTLHQDNFAVRADENGVDSKEKVDILSELLGMPKAKNYIMNLEEMMAKKKEISSNEEGWIVKFKNGKRLKIKGDEYIRAHKVLYGLSDKAKVTAWANGELEKFTLMLPEEFRPELEELGAKLEDMALMIKDLLDTLFIGIDRQSETQKDFALMVNKHIEREYKSFMFDARTHGEISLEKVRIHIQKNYKHYLEAINHE
jgi:RNA ligase